VKLLREHGASTEDLDPNGHTPFDIMNKPKLDVCGRTPYRVLKQLENELQSPDPLMLGGSPLPFPQAFARPFGSGGSPLGWQLPALAFGAQAFGQYFQPQPQPFDDWQREVLDVLIEK
jgi:hypothetical protein